MIKILLFSFLLLMSGKTVFAGVSDNKNANYCLVESVKKHNFSFSTAENLIKNNPKKKKEIRKKTRKKGVKYYIFAVLIASTIGILGIDRLYLRYKPMWLLKLFTLGGLGVWWLIDLFRIIAQDLKPKNGEYDV